MLSGLWGFGCAFWIIWYGGGVGIERPSFPKEGCRFWPIHVNTVLTMIPHEGLSWILSSPRWIVVVWVNYLERSLETCVRLSRKMILFEFGLRYARVKAFLMTCGG